jgi:hypothetical protein
MYMRCVIIKPYTICSNQKLTNMILGGRQLVYFLLVLYNS